VALASECPRCVRGERESCIDAAAEAHDRSAALLRRDRSDGLGRDDGDMPKQVVARSTRSPGTRRGDRVARTRRGRRSAGRHPSKRRTVPARPPRNRGSREVLPAGLRTLVAEHPPPFGASTSTSIVSGAAEPPRSDCLAPSATDCHAVHSPLPLGTEPDALPTCRTEPSGSDNHTHM
jgi:hypothetical protein